jgi:ABC-type bacteriocin/lantibiotic exporter with double-glycine peptidase domain
VIVAHRPETIASADRVLTMHDGTIAPGPHRATAAVPNPVALPA